MKKKMLSVLLSGTLVFGITFAPVQAVFADEPLPEREFESGIPVYEEQTQVLTASDEREQATEQPTMRAEKKAQQKQTVQSGTVEGLYGDGYSWTLDQEGTLTVTSEDDWMRVDGWDLQKIKDRVSKLVISEGATDLSLYSGSNKDKSFTQLKELELPSTLEELSGDLAGAKNLETVTGGKNIVSANMETFAGTKWAKRPGFVTLGKTLLGYNGEVKELKIPDGIETIGARAFCDNKKLQLITIPKSVTTIESEAFAGCSALTEIKGGENAYLCADDAFDGVPWNNGMIILRNRLIRYNGEAKELKIPDGVMGIGDSAFSDNKKLQSITIPKSVLTIGLWGLLRLQCFDRNQRRRKCGELLV